MSSSNSKSSSGGLGVSSILLIIFIVLKATKLIDWSWWWVFSPVWIPLLLLVVFGILYLIVSAIASAIGKREINKMKSRL